MTKSVAELQRELAEETERDTGIVAAPQLAGAQLPPAPRLMWLKQVLTELGLPYDFLSGAEDLARRASAMRTDAVTAQMQASQRRQSALTTLGRDQGATIAAAVEMWSQQAPWLDVQQGQTRPLALQLAEDAARLIEGQITGHIYSHAPKLFGLAQRRAGEIVAEVKSLPTFPKQIWEYGDPADELAKYKEHRGTWGVLVAARNDFWLCHAVSDLVRDQLGYGYASFPDGAPRTAIWAKNWRPGLNDVRYPKLKAPMRLPYAIANDYQPGVWTPGDVTTTAADRSFAGRMRNLGQAVGVNI